MDEIEIHEMTEDEIKKLTVPYAGSLAVLAEQLAIYPDEKVVVAMITSKKGEVIHVGIGYNKEYAVENLRGRLATAA